ncbi:MAG: TetR/AcrR family transcriptional regulator, partial [Candidatus Afipia apatlaquensis]|nr:TetR/AcrR family transcriptional regulator [Candidatus Afipia apatlaquensis]
ITAFSYFHVSNRHTLSLMFDKDLGDAGWLEDRRRHAHDVIMAWLTVPDTLRKDGKKVSSPKLSPVQGKTPNLV